jgi:hypothetical protein
MEMSRGRQAIVASAAVVGGVIGGLAAGEGMAFKEGLPMGEAQDQVNEAEGYRDAAVAMAGVAESDSPVGEDQVEAANQVNEQTQAPIEQAYLQYSESRGEMFWVFPADVEPVEGPDGEELSPPQALVAGAEADVADAEEELSGVEGDVDSARTKGRGLGGAVGAVGGGALALVLTSEKDKGNRSKPKQTPRPGRSRPMGEVGPVIEVESDTHEQDRVVDTDVRRPKAPKDPMSARGVVNGFGEPDRAEVRESRQSPQTRTTRGIPAVDYDSVLDGLGEE